MRSRLSGYCIAAMVVASLGTDAALAKRVPTDPVDLTNFGLGPEHAQWLVGPVTHLASEAERTEYLQLREDEAAEAFIDEFWGRRGPNTLFPPSGPKYTFEARAKEADKTFTEGTHLGRRSDRGTIYILYGSPANIERASSPTKGGPPIEIWNYLKTAEPGLDGKKPNRRYGFRRDGAVTKLFPLGGLKKPRRTRGRIGELD